MIEILLYIVLVSTVTTVALCLTLLGATYLKHNTKEERERQNKVVNYSFRIIFIFLGITAISLVISLILTLVGDL